MTTDRLFVILLVMLIPMTGCFGAVDNADAEENDGSCLFSIVGGVWNVYNIEYFNNDVLGYSGPPVQYPDIVSLQFKDDYGLLGIIQPDGNIGIDTIIGWIDSDSLYLGSYLSFQYEVSSILTYIICIRPSRSQTFFFCPPKCRPKFAPKCAMQCLQHTMGTEGT